MTVLAEQFTTASLRQSPRGGEICQILAAAIHRVDAGMAIKDHVHLADDFLDVEPLKYPLAKHRRVFMLAVGKAAIPMATSLSEVLGNILTAGLVITKQGYLPTEHTFIHPEVSVLAASHPIPDISNLQASEKLISFLAGLTEDDLVICLISGGGSALLTKPSPGISLNDLQATTQVLLSCGAEIGEFNTIRKHLEEFKGGKLARSFYPSRVLTLVLSDVLGDHLDQIASGPTVADPTTYRDAWSIISKYRLQDLLPAAVLEHIQAGMRGEIPETIKPGDPVLAHVQNVVIGNNASALRAAEQQARLSGFSTQLVDTPLSGEASTVGAELCEKARAWFSSIRTLSRPSCLIAGGETTVHIHGNGLGGRNQELALGAVQCMSGDDPLILVSLATDGDDGPTGAAGAVVTNRTYRLGLSKGLNPKEYLANNDSYHYFERLDDLIKTGPTLTNVNDLVIIFSL